MSGMWGVMYWLFVTPVYWISAVWYRRMRCLTLGDWFVERYESKSMGVAYAVFGCFYYMTYGAMLFTAIGKVAVPLMGPELFGAQTEYVLVPLVRTRRNRRRLLDRPRPRHLHHFALRPADPVRAERSG
jgi:SSS family solute:Na+ symporter